MSDSGEPAAQGAGAESVFSGQTYNPDQNTVTHYKNNKPRKKKKRKCKKKIPSVFS